MVVIIAKSIPEEFQYELRDYPITLFSNGQMKDVGKWRFAKRLCDIWGEDSIIAEDILIDPALIYDRGMFVQEMISLWIEATHEMQLQLRVTPYPGNRSNLRNNR